MQISYYPNKRNEEASYPAVPLRGVYVVRLETHALVSRAYIIGSNPTHYILGVH
jgi:hypothetical protein